MLFRKVYWGVIMDYRKLIKFGRSSYVISLPKDWIDQNKLKKGNIIYVNANKNQLTLSPESHQDEERRSIIIDVKKDKFETIKRKIISCYLNNYSNITVLLDPEKNNKKIREIFQNLVALEVIEQDSHKMVAKDYLNLSEISITSIVRKLDNLIRSFLKDINGALAKDRYFQNAEICEEISERDADVNKLTFLILKTIKHRLNNWEPEKGIMTPEKLLNHWELAKTMEALADNIKRTIRLLLGLDLNKYSEVVDILKLIEEHYLNSMKTYYMQDVAKAYDVATQKNVILARCTEFFDENADNPEITKLVESFKGFIRNVHSITRLTYE
jgi:phosphate uptake regulator